jgi:hypothetical protein
MAIWLIVFAICVGVVRIAQVNTASDRLETLGFDVCDREACFRGIKLRMEWLKVQAQHLEAEKRDEHTIIYAVKGVTVRGIALTATPDLREVQSIHIFDDLAMFLPITAGEGVARYGLPCKVLVSYIRTANRSKTRVMYLEYPTLLAVAVTDPYDRLRPDAPLTAFSISRNYSGTSCKVIIYPDSSEELWPSSWRGFASTKLYLADYRRLSGATP